MILNVSYLKPLEILMFNCQPVNIFVFRMAVLVGPLRSTLAVFFLWTHIRLELFLPLLPC